MMVTGFARLMLLCAAAATLSGCGFHPLYAPSAHLQSGLAEIYVDVVPNRNGQLFRQALQERLQGAAENPQQHYELSVDYNVSSQGIGIEQDNASTRNRFIGTAKWTLHKPGAFGEKIASGIARTVDGNDVVVAQFFYSDLNAEAVNRRIGEALADQVVQALAIYFRNHPGLV
jgi:LPS-assembly lipoprotein